MKGLTLSLTTRGLELGSMPSEDTYTHYEQPALHVQTSHFLVHEKIVEYFEPITKQILRSFIKTLLQVARFLYKSA